MVGISIVIPCFNESKRLHATFKKLRKYEKQCKHKLQFVFMDDGSTDNTANLISHLGTDLVSDYTCIYYRKNRGKGYAVRMGLQESKHPYKLILDADLSIGIGNLDNIPLNSGYYVVKGRRNFINLPFARRLLGFGWHIVTYIITDLSQDTQSPFTFLNLPQDLYKDLKVDGFSYDVEILLLAKKYNIPIYELMVNYQYEKGSKVTFKKSLRMFIDLLKLS